MGRKFLFYRNFQGYHVDRPSPLRISAGTVQDYRSITAGTVHDFPLRHFCIKCTRARNLFYGNQKAHAHRFIYSVRNVYFSKFLIWRCVELETGNWRLERLGMRPGESAY